MTFDDLVGRCKASVHLSVNDHKGVYEPLKEWLTQMEQGDFSDIPSELLARMLEGNICYRLQFYPDTPVGFYAVYGTTLQECLDQAEEALAQ